MNDDEELINNIITDIIKAQELFSNELCSLNDNILSLFDEEKPDKEKDFLKLKIISPMSKILVFLSFYYNDQLIISALKGEKSPEKLKFYHRLLKPLPHYHFFQILYHLLCHIVYLVLFLLQVLVYFLVHLLF